MYAIRSYYAHKKPAYLFALCAGDYDVYRDSFTTMNGDEIALRNNFV